MSIPTPVPAGSPGLVAPTPPAPSDPGATSAPDPWSVLATCLTLTWPERLSALSEALGTLRDTGARVFEAVVGSPVSAYGPRLTLDAGPDPADLAARLGFAEHPWGPPDWYGLRVGDDGAPSLKPYHRMRWLRGRFTVPDGLPADLVPELGALVGRRRELYLRRRPEAAWPPFAQECAALVGAPAPACAPVPRVAAWAHAVSLRFEEDALTAVTLYAEDRCLPGDAEIAAAWTDGLDATDRRAYEAAVGGVRALRPPDPRGVHAMLGWTLEVDGRAHRAVSLRISERPELSSST